jgi:hypothetical protein
VPAYDPLPTTGIEEVYCDLATPALLKIMFGKKEFYF